MNGLHGAAALSPRESSLTLTRGPVDIDLGPLEVHSRVYQLPVHDLAPYGTYLMDVIGDVDGSEAGRDSLTYEVVPPTEP